MIPQRRQEADAKTDCYYTKMPPHVKKIAGNTGTSGMEKVFKNEEFENQRPGGQLVPPKMLCRKNFFRKSMC
jgi:hypothetical protein